MTLAFPPIADAAAAAMRADTYTTLDGRVLDLRALADEERRYLARCYAAYARGMAWDEFGQLASGPQHPLLRDTGGVVTPGVWSHPLYQAVTDLEDRLGIAQGELDPDPGTQVASDPLAVATSSQQMLHRPT